MGRIAIKCVLLAATILILSAGLAFAQPTMMSGNVVGEDGKAVQNAVIRIDRVEIKATFRTKTNRKGDWSYAGLPAGTYNVTLEMNGADVETQAQRAASGTPAVANFDLAARKKRTEEMQAAAEAGKLDATTARGMSEAERAAFEKAVKERGEALSKNKALNESFNRAMEAIKVQQWQVAIDALNKAAEVDPKQHVVWGHLGDSSSSLASQKTGAEQEALVTKALEAYQKAIEIKPDDAAYHNNYALALVKAKKVPEARTELAKAAEIDPPNAGKYYFNLGAVMMNTGQTEQAGEAFKKAIEINPNYAAAHYQYGLFLVSKAQIGADGKILPPAGTREEFQTYLKLEPNGANAEQARSLLATFDQAIQTDYVNPDAKKKPSAPKKK